MFMFIGGEDRPVSSVVSLGVADLFDLPVTAHSIPGYVDLITGVFASVFPIITYVFPVRFSVGSTISILK